MVITSSNNSKIITIHEVSQECIWLTSIIQHIKKKYGLSTIENNLIILFEDNIDCITQLKRGFIKRDKTKHILPKLFYTYELQQKGD